MQPDDWEALEEEKENKNRLEIRWVGVAAEPACMWVQSGWDSNSAVALAWSDASVSLCLAILAQFLHAGCASCRSCWAACSSNRRRQQRAACHRAPPPPLAPQRLRTWSTRWAEVGQKLKGHDQHTLGFACAKTAWDAGDKFVHLPELP